MDMKKSKQILLILAAVYWAFAIGIYAIANEQFRYTDVTGDAPAAELMIGEVTDERVISQNITAPADVLESISVMTGTYDRTNSGMLHIELSDAQGTLLAEQVIPASDCINNDYTLIPFDQPVEVTQSAKLTVLLYSEGCSGGNAVTIYAGNTLSVDPSYEAYTIANELTVGSLCIRLSGYNCLTFYQTYWIIVIAVFAVLAAYCAVCWKGAKQGKSNGLVSLMTAVTRYSFLMKQLVTRDFKSKYKRSALGMAWSLLNPLLTMGVQYLVFSTVFRNNIENYPVYLLTGIVFFNFFSEAISLGMNSIVNNAPLIKKVYMPKYIYPISRIVSSLINFLLALIPLLLVMLITGITFRPSLLLLAYDILCYLGFIIGLTLLLATATTFFQDVQFLWTVVSMMWQYLTPIFYPETIIPEQFLPLYRLNPMYQFITFARTCIIDGVSPEPAAYFYCTFSALIALVVGIFVFRKYENKFVLYL